jgi:hypothetical protein
MKPTMIAAEEAAEVLGIDVYDLGYQLRIAASEAAHQSANEIAKGYALDVGRARRLLRAAEACEAAWAEVAKAEALPA